MSLAPGAKLGPYEIQAPLGAGGMGEVYRARDTRLDRTVAIKIVPAHLSNDLTLRQRFEREAKTISGLNHPNICVLYDIGDQNGTHYLVMECVEGETLGKRLERGPLPLKEVLKYGMQIADALDKAHRSGVIHRDLKPGNIMLTASGAKLLDFGLAKAAPPLAAGATLTAEAMRSTPVTQQGTVVGTFQYMSPEQVEGKEVDARSDIFSFGSVLYEMVTGRRAFVGKSQLSVASAILEKEPEPISSLQPLTPPALDRAIRRCVAKDPEERWQAARDLLLELKWISEAGSQPGAAAPLTSRPKLRERIAWVVAVALAISLSIIVAAWRRSPAPQPRPVMRWTTTLPYGTTQLALSRDGSHLAFIARANPKSGSQNLRQLYVRATDQLESKPLETASDLGSYGLCFSPDGNWIAYRPPGRLKKIPTSGGASITLTENSLVGGASWGADDTIIIGAGFGLGLSRVPAAGGKLETLTTPDREKGEFGHDYPYFLPGGKAVLFGIRAGASWDESRIAALDLRTREKHILVEAGMDPRYAPTGHLIYWHSGSLFAVPFDSEHLRVRGSATPVLEGVEGSLGYGFANYSFSESGDMVYVPSSAQRDNRTLVWVDRKGHMQTLPAPQRAYANPSISPDGRRVAVAIGGGPTEGANIWVYDLKRQTLTRLTYGTFDYSPIWTPDGQHVTFRTRDRSTPNDLFWVPADSNRPPEKLVSTELPATPGSWMPDASALFFYRGLPLHTEMWVLPFSGTPQAPEPKAHPLIEGFFDATLPQISPDGHWLAYASDQSGISQIYVQPYPSLGGKWQISVDGGDAPRWARNEKELFYRNGDKMMVVDIETQPSFRAGTPKVLFEGHYEISPFGIQPGFGYDVSPDGKRFLMVKAVDDQNATELRVVQNWFEELRRRVPTGKN